MLLPKAGYALGGIARMDESGKTILGYFFWSRRKNIPELDDLKNYSAKDAIWVHRFDFLGLKNKEWTVLGSMDKYEIQIKRN